MQEAREEASGTCGGRRATGGRVGEEGCGQVRVGARGLLVEGVGVGERVADRGSARGGEGSIRW